MKILISESQFTNLREGIKKSTESQEKRFELVADTIIRYMDTFNLKTIPLYRFLQTVDAKKEMGFSMKQFMEKYLNQGEYDGYVKPLIRKKRPEFTYTKDRKLGANNYLVDDGVAVKSLGEVIVYNTFKMNGIILSYEDPTKEFYYLKDPFNGVISTKKPDFFWEEAETVIEVAGFDDISRLGEDYETKLMRSKEEIEKMGFDMIILDYVIYKNKPSGFYKMICEKFNFPYEEDKFWLSVFYEGMDKENYLNQVKQIIKKGKKKTRGEQDILNKIITRYLTKTEIQPDGEKREVGYKNVTDFKRETGTGLKWSDEEELKKITRCWCASSGSNQKTYEKYREIFPGDVISKLRIETVKKKFPEKFDMNNREELCKSFWPDHY